MAEWIGLIKKGEEKKAEQLLRVDFDVCAKQSINVREPKALGVNLDGAVFYITGSDEGVKKCIDVLKPFVSEAKAKELEKAKKKILEEQEKAAEGFGGIFG